MTIAGSGFSKANDSGAAATEAVLMAKKRCPAPITGFVFASSKHDLAVVLEAAQRTAGCALITSQTAGEFTEAGAMRGAVVVLLLGESEMVVELAMATGVRADPKGVGARLSVGFTELTRKAASRGFGLSTTVLLLDSLSGNGEQVVKEVLNHTRLYQQIVGGAAGDDGQFQATHVGAGAQAAGDAAAALHVFDSRAWGVGVDHGLTPVSKPMTVTKAKGSVLVELDRRPAFEAYRRFAGERGVELTAQNTNQFLIGNELGVLFLDELHHARAAVGVGKSGELQLVATITEGAQVCFLDGQPDAMVEAARRAATQARANLDGAPVAGVLVFDCICRGMILGREFQREIEAVKSVFPNTPIAGFLTYGEIARFRGKLDGWHNATAVVAAIPA